VRILVANPNSTEAITEACLGLARAAASPGTDVAGWTNRDGPPVIDSVHADYLAGPALVRGLRGVRPAPDAVVLAGFGNYGTAAVKEVLDVPVVAMAEAAMALAVLLCHRFVVVTTAPRMVPYTEDLVRLAGFDARCAGVRAVSLPPLTAAPPDRAALVRALAEHAARAQAELGATSWSWAARASPPTRRTCAGRRACPSSSRSPAPSRRRRPSCASASARARRASSRRRRASPRAPARQRPGRASAAAERRGRGEAQSPGIGDPEVTSPDYSRAEWGAGGAAAAGAGAGSVGPLRAPPAARRAAGGAERVTGPAPGLAAAVTGPAPFVK
jgi:allantoin racemase